MNGEAFAFSDESRKAQFGATKVCSRCRRELPVADFSYASRVKLYAWCRDCARTYQREVYRTFEGQMKHRVRAARGRAQRFGLDFDLAVQDLLELWDEQDGKCAISGLPMVIDSGEEKGKQAFRPSVDRIVPKRGYVRGNIRLVTTIVNFGINKWGLDPFLAMCEGVVQTIGERKAYHDC